MDFEAQLAAQLQYEAFSKMIYTPSELGQTDPVLICDESSSVGLCLRVVVIICATLVNTLTLLTGYAISSAS